MNRSFALFCLTALFTTVAFASPATDSLLAQYKAAGVTKTDAAKAKKDWMTEVVVDGEKMSCSTCHGTDLSKAGKHHKTGKAIEAMSPRVTIDRFTEEKKIEKWFKRNCKDAWGRECTVQEKADFLTFLTAQ
jgi:cytochrome c5